MFKDDQLSLVYFTSDPLIGRTMIKDGVDALLLDCETVGKNIRQKGFNTQINSNKPDQIEAMRAINPTAHIMCRVNNADDRSTEFQIQLAIKYGVNIIVLPLTESRDHVRKINKIINDRVKLIIMIETQKGVNNFKDISKEKFDAVYVGLNDLSISRGGRPLFEPLVDGTMENLIANTNRPVGVGGATDPSEGYPIKSGMIISEYARLGVKFTVLRRSFEQTIQTKPAIDVIKNIKQSYDESSGSRSNQIQARNILLRTMI